MHINSICVERGRRLGLIVTTITPLEATLPWPCSPHLPLSPSVPSQMPRGSHGLEALGPGENIHQVPLNESFHLSAFPFFTQKVEILTT